MEVQLKNYLNIYVSHVCEKYGMDRGKVSWEF